MWWSCGICIFVCAWWCHLPLYMLAKGIFEYWKIAMVQLMYTYICVPDGVTCCWNGCSERNIWIMNVLELVACMHMYVSAWWCNLLVKQMHQQEYLSNNYCGGAHVYTYVCVCLCVCEIPIALSVLVLLSLHELTLQTCLNGIYISALTKK